MKDIVAFERFGDEGVRTLGGKGYNLCKMAIAGFPVPGGFIITADVFRQFLKENEIGGQVLDSLKESRGCDLAALGEISKEITNLISKGTFPVNVGKHVRESFRRLGCKYAAVRSSAVAEDSKKESWAGELESYLYITEKNLIPSVKKCYASLFSERALVYRLGKRVKDQGVAVVVQKMIDSEVSGVAFSIDPVTKDKDMIVIEAAYGLGEAVVSGLVNPDRYEFDKKRMDIRKHAINKQEFLLKNTGKTLSRVDLDSEAGALRKLDDQSIRKVAYLCQRLESCFQAPQDVEWAYEGGRLYVLQSRPVVLR